MDVAEGSTVTVNNTEVDGETVKKVEVEVATTEPVPNLIKIIVLNDVPYVWDSSEYLRLRKEHRIFGALDGGTVKNYTKNYLMQSLPVRLSGIEAYYLVKHGMALAFEIPALKVCAPEVPVERVNQLKKQRKEEQLEVHRKKRKLEIEALVDKIIEGKRRKARGIVPDKQKVIQDEMQKVALPFETTQIDLVDPWITESDYVPCELPVPSTPMERLRYNVFEDFHLRRKYYVGAGLKFGGDFLAYPGDPRETHSEFIILCHDHSKGDKPPFIKSQIRLANVVKKILLIATLDKASNRVKYKVMNSVRHVSGSENGDENSKAVAQS